MWYGDGGDAGLATLIADHASPEEIVEARTVLDREMGDARQRLGAGDGEPVAVTTNAALIVFREGLEAVLILAAITASMTGRFARYRRPFLIGAGSALGLHRADVLGRRRRDRRAWRATASAWRR